ncbi:glycosyl transferase [Salmonella enterica]|nr:glycosyl transferase [Salmonella enterica]
MVSRRIYRPRDLFSLMQSTLATEKFFISAYEIGIIDNFPEIRVQEEVSARENRVRRFGGEPEILISEIYDEILKKHPQLSPATVKKIIDLEIQMEKIVLYKNARGSCLFEKAISDGCKVILISDMYLPSAILKELLTSCGYDISNIPVYSSGEERYSKNSGKLFSIVKKNENVDIASWIHVGDNVHADILNAKKLGINTLHADWSEYNHGISNHWKAKDIIGESICKTLLLKQVSAFHQNDPLNEIGFKVFGPLLLGYVSWLANQLKIHKIDKAFFLARDAHLIYKIYNEYFSEEHVKCEYLYISRASAYMVGMTDWPMHRIWHLFGGKNKKSIKKILAIAGLDASEHISDIHHVGFPDEEYIPVSGEEHKVHWLINKLFPYILLKNTQHREVYADYFKTACEGFKNIALIDVGWMGNIQSVFARSLGAQWAEKQIHGFYLATFSGANDNRSIYNKMFGWLTNYGHPHDKCELFLSGGVEIMEFAMADNTGSTIGYKKTDNGIIPVREDSSGSEIEYLKKAARLQSGIISFFEYVKPLIQKGNYAALSSVVLSEPFFELIARPSSAQLDALSSLTHSESAGSNAERIVLAKKLPLKDKLFPGENYIKELNASYWKEGFKRINRKKFWAKYN